MALTSLSDRKTPGRPIEITFDPETGLPSANQEVLLIGERGSGAASGSAAADTVVSITNSGDLAAASGECATKFGEGSQLQKMVLAAISANAGASSVPQLKAIPLANGATDLPDATLEAVKRVKAEFVVSPFDGSDTDLTGDLETLCQEMSGAERVENNQYGTIGVVFNRSVSDPSLLPAYDTQFLAPCWLPDSGSPTYSVAESAAACAAKMAQQGVPFNPLDNVVIEGLEAPEDEGEWITVGPALESESALDQGWTPLRVKSNGDVSFVRTVTARTTVDGTVEATAYYDVQDFQVLYYFRKTVFSRLNQSDLKQVKASQETAKLIKSEIIRLAQLFEDQGMFQAVSQLAPQFVVERSSSDRHRFDVAVPVNVVPGLHVVATNIKAGVQFDSFSI